MDRTTYRNRSDCPHARETHRPVLASFSELAGCPPPPGYEGSDRRAWRLEKVCADCGAGMGSFSAESWETREEAQAVALIYDVEDIAADEQHASHGPGESCEMCAIYFVPPGTEDDDEDED
jgi:hypothetical protein